MLNPAVGAVPTTLSNTAHLSWNLTNKISGVPSGTAGGPTDKSTTDATASITVQQPSLSVVKKVNALDATRLTPANCSRTRLS